MGEGRAVFFPAVSLFCVWASRLARLNCRLLTVQFFLSGDVCCWAFVSQVPCASTGSGSKIVISIGLAKRFRDEMSSAGVGSVSKMLRICKFMQRCFPYRCFAARFVCSSTNLVDPASSHMLASKIKPLHGNTANGALKQ